ncbi:hypothetical protein ACFXKW_34130 [Streptomyces sp. NPDC059193]|uniref:hypothetical protein n=1 Tax=Streptomyces sp. NPDC059193 TaxID=3346763 RepID=UPI0036B184C3
MSARISKGVRGKRPRWGLRWLMVIVATLLIALSTTVAFAEPSPAPSDPAATAPAAPAPTPAAPTPDVTTPPKDASDGLLQPFNVTDEYGVPISAYTVRADSGDWNDIDLKIWNVLAQFFFGVAKWFIGFSGWLVDWALDFGLPKVLVGPVDDIAGTIRDQVINRLGLPGLFLTFAAVYAGWHIMFKQRSRGFAEAGMSLVIAAVATTLLISPAQVLLGTQDQPSPGGKSMLLSEEGLIGGARDLSLQVSSLVLSDDPKQVQAKPETVSKPITNALVDAFIVKPTQLMLYGEVFDKRCSEAFAKYKLVEYKWMQAGKPLFKLDVITQAPGTPDLEAVTKAGEKFAQTCGHGDKKALDTKKASADMAFSAVFVALAAIIVSVLMCLVAGGFLVAQGWIAFEAIRGHWALCAGILPGGGRAVLWRWVAAITKAALAVVLSILFLAIFILVILALIKADTGKVLAVKFISIDIAAIAGLAGHKKIKETARQISVNLNRRLHNARIGGSRQSVFSSYGRFAETAPGLKQVWGEASGEASKVTKPLGAIGRTAKQLWTGSPQAGKKGGRLRAAARIAGNTAAVVGTGGAAAAGKLALQNAAKQTLKKRLATAATNKLSQTRGGRATMATGKAAQVAGKYGLKAGKFAFMATAGAPVGIPRAVAATKRGAQGAMGRATAVKDDLVAAKNRGVARVDSKVGEAVDFGQEWKRNAGTAVRFAGRHAANAQLGLAQPLLPASPTTPSRNASAATAPRVPGGLSPKAKSSVKPPAAQPKGGSQPTATKATGTRPKPTPKTAPKPNVKITVARTAGQAAAPSKSSSKSGPGSIPAVPTTPAPAAQAGPATPTSAAPAGGSKPPKKAVSAAPQRVRRVARRPAGPPRSTS